MNYAEKIKLKKVNKKSINKYLLFIKKIINYAFKNKMDSYKDWITHLINERYEWIIPSRYTDLKPLGSGSFGLVWFVI